MIDYSVFAITCSIQSNSTNPDNPDSDRRTPSLVTNDVGDTDTEALIAISNLYDPTIPTLHDPSITYSGSQLLTEFFNQMTLWWLSEGQSGGIWCDWAAIAGCFMDTPFRCRPMA